MASEEIVTLWENVGAALRQVRQMEGMTQRQAATLANSTQARLSDLEIGKADMMLSTLQRWADVYGYTVEIHMVPNENVAKEPNDEETPGTEHHESARENGAEGGEEESAEAGQTGADQEAS